MNCLTCNSTILKTRNNRGKTKYCDLKCYFLSPKRKRIFKTCTTCNAPIFRKNKFCSQKCRLNEKTALCKVCSSPFTYRGYRVKTNSCCSYKCARSIRIGEGNPNYKMGKKDLKLRIRFIYKTSGLQKEVLTRDNFKCQQCGQIGGKLEVDHKIKFSLLFETFIEKNLNIKNEDELFILSKSFLPFWDTENLQVLCKKCNWTKELKFRKYKKSHKKHTNV